MKKLIPILLILLSSIISAQDSTEKIKKLTITGYIKSLESISFSKDFKENISGNLIHNRINAKWKPIDKITVAAEFRNRFFWGEEVKATPGFATLLRNNNEKINLSKIWLEKNGLVLHTNIERLYFDYRKENWNLRVGRQRINWGITTTWNPNDIFNAYNFLDFDYEERPGSDGTKFQYLFNDFFNTEIAFSHGDKNKSTVSAIRYFLNRWNYDMQLITGWYKDHITLGAGWAGNIKDAGFKGEIQYFFKTKDSSDHLNMTMEVDYVFKKGWYVNAGFLLNNRGLNEIVSDWNKVNLNLSAENIMPTKWNFIFTTRKEINPLLTGSFSVLYSPNVNLLIL
ncbi:MAG: hypothetical protein ACM3H8_16240, partial [Sphingobacteriales bacterium]